MLGVGLGALVPPRALIVAEECGLGTARRVDRQLAPRDDQIYVHAERGAIAKMSLLGLDEHSAADDAIEEAAEFLGLFSDQLVQRFGWFEPTIGDLQRLVHGVLNLPPEWEEVKSRKREYC